MSSPLDSTHSSNSKNVTMDAKQSNANSALQSENLKDEYFDKSLANIADEKETIKDNIANREGDQPLSLDDIPEPIKVLDNVISEFEEVSKPTLMVTNGEQHSEDDGYMSLSRKNMHNNDSEEMSQGSLGSSAAPLESSNKSFPELDPCPFIPDADNTKTTSTNIGNSTDPNAMCTLPKARNTSSSTKSSNYSSLPCCGARSTSSVSDIKTRGASCNGDRNVLGIDISAVHNAVLRGGLVKLPEPMLNEHPVTIYPGRKSPSSDSSRTNRHRHISSSVEKHKEVCQILNPLASMSSTSSSSSTSPSTTTHSTSDSNKKSLPFKLSATDKSHKLIIISSGREKKKKQRSCSADELSDQTLSTAESFDETSCSEFSRVHTSIAWEIQFNKEHKRKKSTKMSTSNTKKKSQGNILGVDEIDSENLSQSKTSKSLEELDKYDRSMPSELSHSSDEKLNYCMSRHASMLGKGTFIIRRGTGNKTRAIDLFTNSPDNHNSSFEMPHPPPPQLEDESPLDCQSYSVDLSNSNTNSRHSLDLISSQRSSPRDRLSLNLDSKCMVKRSESVDSTNERSCCQKEELNQEIKTAYDNNNLVSYKCAAGNTLLNNEYDSRVSNSTTPHTDLAPTLEEDEEQLSDFSYGCAEPLKQIENNISALLRGDISVMRVGEATQPKRVLEFRPGVHKSESAKEMLLSQHLFGPLPPSPPSSNPNLNSDFNELPPLPPTPTELAHCEKEPKIHRHTTAAEIHSHSSIDSRRRRSRDNISTLRHLSDELPPPPPTYDGPPVVPPHRGHSTNSIKSWSNDTNYRKKSPKLVGYGSGMVTTPTGGTYDGGYSTRRYMSYGTKRSLKQSPREEHRLQTSCSLPETPIFARGCDIPRTPFRRHNDPNTSSGSRTAPRSSTSHNITMGNSVLGISGGNTFSNAMSRQRSMNHALASNEMLRLSGAPARGWYPKQRNMRPASTENIDHLTSIRVWDSAAGMSGTGQTRKPQTLPPNLTPSFLHKSPREALRRVTSLLITKKKSKDKKNKPYNENFDIGQNAYELEPDPTFKSNARNNGNQKPKKKGIFKSLWKRTKHISLDQQ